MNFFSRCEVCHKRRFYIAKRSYIVPKVSAKPITSNSEMCGKCHKDLKTKVLPTI